MQMKNRTMVFVVIEVIVTVCMLVGVIGGVCLFIYLQEQMFYKESTDPVYQLLLVSEQYKFDYITYLIVLIYLVGVPSFLIYASVGMISSPIASYLNDTKTPSEGNVFATSEPVVQYVKVNHLSIFYVQTESVEADEPEEFISSIELSFFSILIISDVRVNGGRISDIHPHSTEQRMQSSKTNNIVIKSDYNKGWVTMVGGVIVLFIR